MSPFVCTVNCMAIPHVTHDKVHKTCMFYAMRKYGPWKHGTGLITVLLCHHTCPLMYKWNCNWAVLYLVTDFFSSKIKDTFIYVLLYYMAQNFYTEFNLHFAVNGKIVKLKVYTGWKSIAMLPQH